MGNATGIRRTALYFAVGLVLLHAFVYVLGFHGNRFLQDEKSWLQRYRRHASSLSGTLKIYKDTSNGPQAIGHDDIHSSQLDFLDLMEWEEDCIKEGGVLVRSNETHRSKVRQSTSKCSPPRITDCCEGTYSSGGTVLNVALNKCDHAFQASATTNGTLHQAAREFLNRNPAGVVSGMVRRNCDICQIIEVCRSKNLSITFVGDSVQAQVFQGLIYELQRRNYTTSLANNSTQRDGFWKTKIQYRETLTIQSPTWEYDSFSSQPSSVTIKFFQLYILPFQYVEEMKEVVDSGDILVLGFGLHWNSNERMHVLSLPGAYVSAMTNLLTYIQRNSSRIKLLIHREASAQHFSAPAGDYSPWNQNPNRANECKPITYDANLTNWREACVRKAAYQAGYTYTLVDTNLEGSAPPILSKAPSKVQTTKELHVLPFFNFTAQHYNLHPTEKVVDCTHFCTSPFLYLPLWRSLRIVMDKHFHFEMTQSAST